MSPAFCLRPFFSSGTFLCVSFRSAPISEPVFLLTLNLSTPLGAGTCALDSDEPSRCNGILCRLRTSDVPDPDSYPLQHKLTAASPRDNGNQMPSPLFQPGHIYRGGVAR